MSILMQKSRTLLEEWLVAAADGHKPDGEVAEVRRLLSGTIVEVHYSGEGPPGFYARALFAGEEPVLVNEPSEALRERGTSRETRVHFAKFRLTAPSVVYECSGSSLPERGHEPLTNVVWLCASDQQIADARARLPELLAERSKTRAVVSRPFRRFRQEPGEASA